MRALSRQAQLRLWGVIGLVVSLPGMAIAAEGWQAGFASTKITPEGPVWMSGYASRDRPAEGTRTELWAKVTALQDSRGKLGLLISMDVVGMGKAVSDAICDPLMQELELTRSQIVINASHTHTGPVVGDNLSTMYFLSEEQQAAVRQYTSQLIDKVIRCAMRAANSKVKVDIRYGVGQSRFGVNRRNNPEMLVPKRRFEGQLQGPVDYSVPVLRFVNEKDRTVGILFGYACHATTLSDYQWSGDYPGYAQKFLQARFPEAVAQFFAGCGADINPLPRREPRLAVQYGAALAQAVAETLDGVMEPVLPQLQTSFVSEDLFFDRIPSRDLLRSQVESKDRFVASRAQKWLKVLDGGKAIPSGHAYPVSWWRLGSSVDLVGMGGEVVVEYALALREKYGSSVWAMGYSHDVMAYIPSRRIWDEGGYEGASSMIYYGLPDRWSGTVEEDVLRIIGRARAMLGP